MKTDLFSQMVEKIIASQETIIGPIAIEQANDVKGLSVDWNKRNISFNGDEAKIIDDLVEKYRDFFGQVSVQVCRQAAQKFLNQLPVNQQPTLLR